MLLKSFENMPEIFKNDAVKPFYDKLKKRAFSLILKRIFDIIFSVLFILIFSPIFILIGVAVAIDSGFPIIYKQKRITQFGKEFKVFKFRTMINGADKIGSLVTVNNDSRITKVGNILRKLRLDELPQIFNVLIGDMSLVGTRPEVQKYVDHYTPEMMATLLLPAGITSITSIKYKDEAELLSNSSNADETYVNEILPKKMKYNLEYLDKFNFFSDIGVLFKTLIAVLK